MLVAVALPVAKFKQTLASELHHRSSPLQGSSEMGTAKEEGQCTLDRAEKSARAERVEK